ncbi:hypothetical protein ACVXZ4_02980 [Lacisediminihabitans sp. FW035]
MAVASSKDDGLVRLRPRRSLLWSGILVFIIVPLPIDATLLILGVTGGSWVIPVMGAAIVVAMFLIALYLLQTSYVTISATEIVEREYFTRPVSTPLSKVRTVVIAHTFSSSSSETLPQLLVRDAQGKRILRMRGVFWTEEAIRAAAAAIGTPVDEPADPLTSKQFFEQYSGSAYWFEGRRGLGIAIVVVVGILCVGLTIGLMSLIGLPIRP